MTDMTAGWKAVAGIATIGVARETSARICATWGLANARFLQRAPPVIILAGEPWHGRLPQLPPPDEEPGRGGVAVKLQQSYGATCDWGARYANNPRRRTNEIKA